MRQLLISSLLTFGLVAGALAATEIETESLTVNEFLAYERVSSIPALRSPHSFKPIDNETLVIWATAFDPYLVKLAHPSIDLKWAHAVGLDNRFGRIHERFDAVRIAGLRYPISEIYRLTREQARAL